MLPLKESLTVNPANTEPQKIDIISEKTAKNYQIIKTLLDGNITSSETARVMGYSREHISRLKLKLSKIQLVTPKRLKTAIKSIEYLSDVRNINENDKIKPSDVINASKVFIDRQYPITQVIENHTVTHDIIDLSIYRNDMPDVIDVSPIVKSLTPDSVPQSDISSSNALQVSSDTVSD